MPKAGKPYSCALAISFFNPHHTVGNRKFGMQAQGDVGRLGHGKIGVNNKRRIVAGLAVKGRLKPNVMGLDKANKTEGAFFQTAMLKYCHY